jgi:regulator of protease activity HflC (stomatin/prohibitin superfamily)
MTGSSTRFPTEAPVVQCFGSLIGEAIVVVCAFQTIYTIQPHEQAAELRFEEPKA